MRTLLSWLSSNWWWDMYNYKPWLTLFVTGTTVVVASDILFYIYKTFRPDSKKGSRKKDKKVKKSDRDKIQELNDQQEQRDLRKPAALWNTVLFFPDALPQEPNSTTNQLIHYFDAAQVSIHLCMYLTSHPAMCNIIRKKHREGLVIQVVTDYDTFTAHNNFGPKTWRNIGIEVRMKPTGFLMHHKFAIIDEEAVLTGSLNWTKQGLQHNQENVLVSTNTNIVSKYIEEFYDLWKLFGEGNL